MLILLLPSHTPPSVPLRGARLALFSPWHSLLEDSRVTEALAASWRVSSALFLSVADLTFCRYFKNCVSPVPSLGGELPGGFVTVLFYP